MAGLFQKPFNVDSREAAEGVEALGNAGRGRRGEEKRGEAAGGREGGRREHVNAMARRTCMAIEFIHDHPVPTLITDPDVSLARSLLQSIHTHHIVTQLTRQR